MARVFLGVGSWGAREAEQARRLAASAGDWWAFTHATMWGVNMLDGPCTPVALDVLRKAREEIVEMGGPHTYVAMMITCEVDGLLELGDPLGCTALLREVLRRAHGAMPDAATRLTASLLALRQGRVGEAQAYLDRAQEVLADSASYRGYAFEAVRAELAVACRDWEAAMAAALAGLAADVPPSGVERLLPLAARAAADEVQALTDRGESVEGVRKQLAQLRLDYPQEVGEPLPGAVYASQVAAWGALYDAEVERGLSGVSVPVWERAARACAASGLAWCEAYACWRLAQAQSRVRGGRAAARAAAPSLRRARELAVRLGAAPLLGDVEALAGALHVPLAPVEPVAASGLEGRAGMPPLTRREREVLGHLVAGRTYAEIARDLVLSEKTVSVHISSLLRKTGTRSRVELAGLVRRLAAPHA